MISTHLLSQRLPYDLASTITAIAAATTIQSYARRRHALSTRPPINRYGFTLLRSDTHHFYAFTGTQFVDTLQRWCSTLRGAYSIEVKLQFADGTTSYVPDHAFTATPSGVRWHTTFDSELNMLVSAFERFHGAATYSICVYCGRALPWSSNLFNLMW
jgi:hypothetical protein